MKCPFMTRNADVMKHLVGKATPEQRAALKEHAAKNGGAENLAHPARRAYFVVGWLRILGEDPSKWSPSNPKQVERTLAQHRENIA